MYIRHSDDVSRSVSRCSRRSTVARNCNAVLTFSSSSSRSKIYNIAALVVMIAAVAAEVATVLFAIFLVVLLVVVYKQQ